MVDWAEVLEKQELLRAEAIMEKAHREKKDVVSSLVTHMVSRVLIEQLTGVTPVQEKKVKEDKSAKLKQWVGRHLEQKISSSKLAQELGVSYDVALSIIKDNPFYFTRVGKGIYEIWDGHAEREEAKRNS